MGLLAPSAWLSLGMLQQLQALLRQINCKKVPAKAAANFASPAAVRLQSGNRFAKAQNNGAWYWPPS